MNNKDRMKQILKDTRDHYAADPDSRRSVTDDGDCMYTWGKKHCAVGRYLKKEHQDETWESNNESVNQLCENDPTEGAGSWSLDWCLVDKAQGLDPNFWMNLQDLHDSGSNWEEWDIHVDGKRKYGLTDRGKDAYVRLQDKIADGRYDG